MIAALMLAVVGLPQGSPSVADVAWLAGCWESTRGDRHVTEQWMAPEGNTLLGISRTVVNGKTTEYEFLLIREGARGLEYVAKPSGQAEADVHDGASLGQRGGVREPGARLSDAHHLSTPIGRRDRGDRRPDERTVAAHGVPV